MTIELYDFIKALKTGKTNKPGWSKVVDAIGKAKLNDKILDSIHVGMKNLNDRELKKLIDSL